jgi:hypothetical protein
MPLLVSILLDTFATLDSQSPDTSVLLDTFAALDSQSPDTSNLQSPSTSPTFLSSHRSLSLAHTTPLSILIDTVLNPSFPPSSLPWCRPEHSPGWHLIACLIPTSLALVFPSLESPPGSDAHAPINLMQGPPSKRRRPRVHPPAAGTRRAPPFGSPLRSCGAPCEPRRRADLPGPIGAFGRALWPTPATHQRVSGDPPLPPAAPTAPFWPNQFWLLDPDPTVARLLNADSAVVAQRPVVSLTWPPPLRHRWPTCQRI